MSLKIDTSSLVDTIKETMKWEKHVSKIDEKGRHIELNIRGDFDGIEFTILIMGDRFCNEFINFHCINEGGEEGYYDNRFDLLIEEYTEIYNGIEGYALTGKHCEDCNHELTRSETIGDKKYCNHCRNKRDK